MKEKVKVFKRKSFLSSAFSMTPHNSYSCRCSKLSHVVPPFIIFEKGCKRRWFAPKSSWNSNVLCNCVRALFFALCSCTNRPQKPCCCFDEAALCILFRQAHTVFVPFQRSSCHGNTKLSEQPPKLWQWCFSLRKNETKQDVDVMALRSWLNGGSCTATMS